MWNPTQKMLSQLTGLRLPGSWNNMVTHRVRISNPKQIDKELLAWLQKAYKQVLDLKKKDKN